MSDLNYHHLRLFRAVAREGNLTRAAGMMNLSQSALSSQIKTLEARLGHALFERRGRGLHLSEAGRIALDHAEAIFGTGEELLRVLADAGRTRAVVRVGAVSTLSRNFQLAFIDPVLGRAGVEVILRSGPPAELLPALEALQLDLVLSTAAPAQDAASSLVAHKIAEQRVALVGLPAMACADLETALGRHAVIVPGRASAMRSGWDALVERLDVVPRLAAEVDDMAMMRLLARAGAGLALVPPIVVQDELASGALVELPLSLPITESFFAVTLRRRFPNPLVAELLAAATTPQA